MSVYVGRDPDTGKRRDVARTVHGTRKDAERALLRLRLETGTTATPSRSVTLAELAREYLTWLEGLGRSPSTLSEYERVLEADIASGPGKLPLHRLSVADLDRYYAGMRARGLAPASVRRRHALIRGALGQAERWGWVDRNVAALATLPSTDDTEIDPPSAGVVEALWRAVEDDDPDWAALLRLLAVAGLRRGEVCALRWSDVDLDGATLHVRRAVVHDRRAGSAVVELDTPKHRSRRAVPLAEATVAPGAETVRLHDLRHFVATRLRASGLDLTTVAGYVGHRDETTTARSYAHPLDDALRDAAEVMARLVGG